MKVPPAIFSRAEAAVTFNQPAVVVGLPEREQRLPQLLDGLEGSHPEQVLLQRADEPLGAAIAFRGAEKAAELSMPRKANSFWKWSDMYCEP